MFQIHSHSRLEHFHRVTVCSHRATVGSFQQGYAPFQKWPCPFPSQIWVLHLSFHSFTDKIHELFFYKFIYFNGLPYNLDSVSTLLVLNRTLFNSVNALLALNWPILFSFLFAPKWGGGGGWYYSPPWGHLWFPLSHLSCTWWGIPPGAPGCRSLWGWRRQGSPPRRHVSSPLMCPLDIKRECRDHGIVIRFFFSWCCFGTSELQMSIITSNHIS